MDVARSFTATRSSPATSPQTRDPVSFKNRISAHNRQPLSDRLSSQQTIEGILVMRCEILDHRRMVERDRQQFEVVPGKLLHQK